MNHQEILNLATKFAQAYPGNVPLNHFLAGRGIPEGERYEVACEIARVLAHFRFHIGEVVEAIAGAASDRK